MGDLFWYVMLAAGLVMVAVSFVVMVAYKYGFHNGYAQRILDEVEN